MFNMLFRFMSDLNSYRTKFRFYVVIQVITLWILGVPFRRYSTYTEPQNLVQDISYLLGEADSPTLKGDAKEYNGVPKAL